MPERLWWFMSSHNTPVLSAQGRDTAHNHQPSASVSICLCCQRKDLIYLFIFIPYRPFRAQVSLQRFYCLCFTAWSSAAEAAGEPEQEWNSEVSSVPYPPASRLATKENSGAQAGWDLWGFPARYPTSSGEYSIILLFLHCAFWVCTLPAQTASHSINPDLFITLN